jgi:hypothetical protein
MTTASAKLGQTHSHFLEEERIMSKLVRRLGLAAGTLVVAGMVSAVAVSPASASPLTYVREGTYTDENACWQRAAYIEDLGAAAYCQWDENDPPTWGLYVQWS